MAAIPRTLAITAPIYGNSRPQQSFPQKVAQAAKISYNAPKPAPAPVQRTTYKAPAPAPTPSVNRSPVQQSYSTPAPSQSSYSAPQAPQQQSSQYQDINDQVEDFGAIIDRDYEVALSGLNSQEEELRGQAKSAEGSIQAGAVPVRSAIADAQTQNMQGLQGEEVKAQTQSKSAIQQARDLFRETQQQNIAQLSGLGLSSSSVNEALAEKLGVETARRIAGVTNSTNEIMQNISKERTRVETFFKNKVTELESNLQTQLASVQQGLISGLNQINQARQVAAADKANRRQELLSRAQTAVIQLQTDAQKFSQSLQAWNAQKQASLSEAQKFTAVAPDQGGLKASIQKVQEIAGQGYNPPSFAVNSKGEVSYTVTPGKKKEEEDDNLF